MFILSFSVLGRRTWDVIFHWKSLPAVLTDMLRHLLLASAGANEQVRDSQSKMLYYQWIDDQFIYRNSSFPTI